METLHTLLFELASNERMNILLELKKQKLKLSHICRRLDLTLAEGSRHIQRLKDAKLIQKDPEGLYSLTPYGVLVLSQLSGLDFVCKNRNYFLEYDLSYLPYEFVDRLGELSGGGFETDILKSLEKIEHTLREAKQFVWVLSNQNFLSAAPTLAEKVNLNFDMRGIFPENVMPPNGKALIPSTAPGVQKRVLQKVDAAVLVTDNYAGFSLPDLSGRIDYRAYTGNNSRLIKWCKDLFLYYWEKAKPFVPER